jgi:hypothetical protein
MKILFPLILKYKEYIDEYRLYVATTIQSDIDYMEDFARKNSDFVKTVYCKVDGKITLDDKNKIWDCAYQECKEDDTVYLKLDDDILYFDETLFTDFIKYRLENRAPPLLYPVIINNHFMSWMLQERGVFNFPIKSHIGNTWPLTIARVKNHIMQNKHKQMRIGDFIRDHEILCPTGWGNLEYCYNVHHQFLLDLDKKNIQRYYLPENVVLRNAEAVSINVCSWIGSDLKQLTEEHGEIYNDEPWLSVYLPVWSGRCNEIYAKSVVGHYAYYRQREIGLDKTDILARYEAACLHP